jgi:hypothetical protein
MVNVHEGLLSELGHVRPILVWVVSFPRTLILHNPEETLGVGFSLPHSTGPSMGPADQHHIYS